MSFQLLRSSAAFPLPSAGRPSPSPSVSRRPNKTTASPHLVWNPSVNPPSALHTCILSSLIMMSQHTPLACPSSGPWGVRPPRWEMRWWLNPPWTATPCLSCRGCARRTDSVHRSTKSVTITLAPTVSSTSPSKSWSQASLCLCSGPSRSFQAPALEPRRGKFVGPPPSRWSKPCARSQTCDLSKIWAAFANVM